MTEVVPQPSILVPESETATDISTPIQVEPSPVIHVTEVIDNPPLRPKRLRRPVDRLNYEKLGQTKQHRVTEALSQEYNNKLLIGKLKLKKWKSPGMAEARRRACRRLLLQDVKP